MSLLALTLCAILVGPEFGENTHQHEGYLALPTEHGCTDPVYYNFLQRNDASKVSTKAIFASRSGELAALAVRYAVPTVRVNRGFVMAGGLVSYGSDIVNAYLCVPKTLSVLMTRRNRLSWRNDRFHPGRLGLAIQVDDPA